MDSTAETDLLENREQRTLIIRSNRLLGAALIESGLVSSEAVETAHERLLMNLEAGVTESPSILTYLMFEQKCLKENDLIDYTIKQHHIGLIDIRHYTLDSLPEGCDLSQCFATWSIPFSHRDGTYFIATAHYLSKPVIDAWESLLRKPVFWYATSMRSIMIALKKISAIPEHPENKDKDAQPTPSADAEEDEEYVFELKSPAEESSSKPNATDSEE
jgi:hypothetical protein